MEQEDEFVEESIECLADIPSERLDQFCARVSGETRSFMQRLIAEGDVQVNGRPAKANTRLKVGDDVRIRLRPPALCAFAPENIPLDIVYQDSAIAVINKPQGMVVHPAPGNYSGTLVNALLFHLKDLSGVGGEMRPGIIHRIDKMTSGLIVVAKSDAAHNCLAAQMKRHAMARTYLALVEGNIREDAGIVEAPIGRSPKDRKRMAIVPTGRQAVTHWRVLRRYGSFTLIEAKLETGRTHQIRVHMASLKHPLAGDTVYGPEKPKLGLAGQALHAARLTLQHPETGAAMRFSAPLPMWYAAALQKAGETEPDLAAMIDKLLDGENV